MKSHRFSVLPFLAAFFIAVFTMPTDVVAVNAFEMGHEHTQPWQATVTNGVSRVTASVLTRLHAVVESLRGHPQLLPGACALAACATALTLADNQPGVLLAFPVIVGATDLKSCRQRVADLDVKIAANQQRGAEIDKEINALADKVSGEKREMTEDERKQLTSLRGQRATTREFLTALLEEKTAATKDLAAAEAENDAERRATPAVDADAAAAARANRGAGIIQVGQDRVELDPKRGFAGPRDQLMAIMRAAQTGVVDKRLMSLRPMAAAGGDEAGTHTDPHGGFLLAPAYSPDLLSVRAEVDPIGGRVRSIPMAAERVVFNARVDKNHATSVSGGLTVSRTPQTKAAATSRTEFENVELVAHDLVGAGFATNRILKTSPISFVALLESGFRDEFAAKLIDERLNGDGVMEFEGVVNADCTISITKETGQKADTIIFENVNKARARCWRYGDAIWLANNDTYPQVSTLYMPIGTGGERVRIYEPGSEDAPQGRLLGRPIFFTEFCQKLGDKGDLVLGVWSEFLEGTLGMMEQASSIHVRFLEREEVFLFVIANAAKPWWRSALTPKYATDTLSPFVVVAERA